MASVSVLKLTLSFFVLFTIYSCARAIYNVYFHPLAKFPGPKLRVATFIPYLLDVWYGKSVANAKKLHEKYGDIVRISPRGLSFTTAQAWKDIYSHRPGKNQLQKDPYFYVRLEGIPDIVTANDVVHARYRKLLAHAFSEQATREQEPIITGYVDLLIRKLHEQVKGPKYGIVNIVRWYNFATFDIIGDLTFGQSFGSLESGDYHYWIANIFQGIKVGRILRIGREYPLIQTLFRALTKLYPKSIEARTKHNSYTKEAANKRLAMETDRKDFMSHILRFNDEKGMSEPEILRNCAVLLLAGSETTATLLSGVTYHLCLNKDVLRRATNEVRTKFPEESAITFYSVAQLSYLQAVVEEGLRLYPPVPDTLPRYTPPQGCIIDSHFVPGNTSVGVNHWSTYQSSKNFRDPGAFIPERWLGDPAYAEDQRAAFQPFSMGPRNCIGQNLAYAEMRIILSRMLWNFDMELCEESANWLEQKTYTLWDKGDLFVKLTLRKT